MKTIDEILESNGQTDMRFARAVECSIKINYKALHKAFNDYAAQFTTWTPIAEGLPNDDRCVQVLVNNKKNIYPHQLQDGTRYVYDDLTPSIWRESITHWRDFTDLPI